MRKSARFPIALIVAVGLGSVDCGGNDDAGTTGGAGAATDGGGGAVATGGGATTGSGGAGAGAGGGAGGSSGGGAGGGATGIPAEFFGLHLRTATPWPTIPFGTVRLWDSGTRWQQLNPSQGQYAFQALDAFLSDAKSHGLGDILFTISGTPNWAASDMSAPNCDYTSTEPASCSPPKDLGAEADGSNQYFRDFVHELVHHVEGLDPATHANIASYELWNEFTRDTASWLGTPKQMVRLAEDAKCIITGHGTITATGEACTKQNFHVDVGLHPGARMLTPDSVLTAPEKDVFSTYLGTPGAVAAADVISVHAYVQNGTCCAHAETLVNRWGTLQGVLPPAAMQMPVWSSEGSWGQSDATHSNMGDPPNLDLEQAFVASYYLVGRSLGFARLYWYAYDNSSWGTLWNKNGVNACDDGGSGLGCLTPAGKAYGAVYGWMVGADLTEPCAMAGGTVWTCKLTESNHKTFLVAWDTGQSCSGGSCTTAPFPAPPGSSKWHDLDGATHAVVDGSVPVGLKAVAIE